MTVVALKCASVVALGNMSKAVIRSQREHAWHQLYLRQMSRRVLLRFFGVKDPPLDEAFKAKMLRKIHPLDNPELIQAAAHYRIGMLVRAAELSLSDEQATMRITPDDLNLINWHSRVLN